MPALMIIFLTLLKETRFIYLSLFSHMWYVPTITMYRHTHTLHYIIILEKGSFFIQAKKTSAIKSMTRSYEKKVLKKEIREIFSFHSFTLHPSDRWKDGEVVTKTKETFSPVMLIDWLSNKSVLYCTYISKKVFYRTIPWIVESSWEQK